MRNDINRALGTANTNVAAGILMQLLGSETDPNVLYSLRHRTGQHRHPRIATA